MSNLDQAFIRAYQSGRAARPNPHATPVGESAPAVGAGEGSGVAATASRTTGPAVAAPRSATVARQAMPTQVTDRRRRYFVDAPHPAASRRRAASPEDAAYELAPLAGETAPERAVERTVATGYDDETTLLEPIVDVAPAETSTELQAAYETERFAWPSQVEVLIAAAGTEFSQFMQELAERIRQGRKTLVVTGCERGEGRTTLVLALARLASNRNLRTAIVDADLRSPQTAEHLGLRPELGWDDVVAEHLPLADALIESNEDRLTLLPLRNPQANPRGMAGTTTVAQAVEQLRRGFDLVLIDAGPLPDDEQAIDLAAVLGGCRLDDALVVRDRRRTTPKQVQAVCRRLSVLGLRRWDIVENFTEIQGY